jgi:hypothetical protein
VSAEHKRFLVAELMRIDANVLARCNCAIAGGAVRDVEHGVPFKDVDVAFWNMSIPEFLETWRQYFDRCPHPVVINGENFGMASVGGDDPRLQTVFQFRLLGTPVGDVDVDWLLYGPQFRTLQDVLDSHDHTISQYGMWFDEEFSSHIAYFGKDIGHCYRLRQDVSDQRVARVKEICAALNWSYNGS